jgi:hypothetical protein
VLLAASISWALTFAAARVAGIGEVRREFLMGAAIPLFFGYQRN